MYLGGIIPNSDVPAKLHLHLKQEIYITRAYFKLGEYISTFLMPFGADSIEFKSYIIGSPSINLSVSHCGKDCTGKAFESAKAAELASNKAANFIVLICVKAWIGGLLANLWRITKHWGRQ